MTRHCRRCDRDRQVPDEIAYNHLTCRKCAKAHYRELHQRKPCHGCGSMRRRPARTRYCKRCRPTPAESHREAARRYYLNVKHDPKRYAAFLEIKRMQYRLRAERDGRPTRPVRIERYGKPSKWWVVSAEPLRAIVRTWPEGPEALCRLARLDPMLGHRIANGDKNIVEVATADALCVAAGLHLDLVYDAIPARGSAETRSAALAAS